MSQALPPFSCTFSPGMPELLQQLQCSLAISTYQAGKVILISPKDRDHLVQLPRQFAKPMGIAVNGRQLAIATLQELVLLANDKQLAHSYPRQPATYDALYLPRATFYTGELDIHDVAFTPEGLIGVNTRFSCLARIDAQYNFTPVWKPPFIDNLSGDDCCHLNGLAIENGKPALVTALGKTAEKNGWRENKATGGVLMDINTGSIILDQLPMPHSPRIYADGTYVLLSGTGEVVKVDREKKTYTVIKQLDGFARGFDRIGDYAFIGLSKLRQTSKAFSDLPIAKRSVFCGVVAVHLPTGAISQFIKYENSVEEIYDVRILPGTIRPGILNTEKPDFRMAISTPEKTFWAKETE